MNHTVLLITHIVMSNSHAYQRVDLYLVRYLYEHAAFQGQPKSIDMEVGMASVAMIAATWA